MKRILLPILFAVAQVAVGDPLDVVDDADDDAECVELNISDATRQGPLEVARALSGETVDQALVWRSHGEVRAVVAIATAGELLTPARVLVAMRSPGSENACRVLLSRALRDLRDRGALKVIVQSNDLPLTELRAVTERCGLIVSKTRTYDGTPALEAYVDLYRRHPVGK